MSPFFCLFYYIKNLYRIKIRDALQRSLPQDEGERENEKLEGYSTRKKWTKSADKLTVETEQT